MTVFRRYHHGARLYDVLSGEHLVYRAGRLAGIRMLHPAPGSAVLDLGCGTGLNLPLLARSVAPGGLVIGLDNSQAMLAVAARRIRPYASHVRLVAGDATTLDVDRIRALLADSGRPATLQAVFASYAFSVFPDWRPAWARTRQLLEPGARVAVVDMQPPTGRAAVFRPLAALAAATGGADLTARPWRAVQEDCEEVTTRTIRGGHVVITAGSYRGGR